MDEEGTEAAAVTSVVMMRCMAMAAEPPSIKLNRWVGGACPGRLMGLSCSLRVSASECARAQQERQWLQCTRYDPTQKLHVLCVCMCRPFLFMLVDDASSTPLFVGTVLDPSK